MKTVFFLLISLFFLSTTSKYQQHQISHKSVVQKTAKNQDMNRIKSTRTPIIIVKQD